MPIFFCIFKTTRAKHNIFAKIDTISSNRTSTYSILTATATIIPICTLFFLNTPSDCIFFVYCLRHTNQDVSKAPNYPAAQLSI